ncbi:unnamed protein product [Trichobilharzia regenti]|nr:unnamed protein product [Trichobilharzia regenti]
MVTSSGIQDAHFVLFGTRHLDVPVFPKDNPTTYGNYGRQRSGSLYPTRTRNYSVTREGSVFSVMSEMPPSPHKTRFQLGTPRLNNRYDTGSQLRDNGSSLSLLDLPPAETDNN